MLTEHVLPYVGAILIVEIIGLHYRVLLYLLKILQPTRGRKRTITHLLFACLLQAPRNVRFCSAEI